MNKTALVVVDYQNDFVHPNGALYVNGAEFLAHFINLLTSQVGKDRVVIYTRDYHPVDHSSFQTNGGQWPAHCIAGSRGAEFHPSLKLYPDVVCLYKGQDKKDPGYSAFSGLVSSCQGVATTDSLTLQEYLHAEKIDSLEICGVATDYCVAETISDALKLGYKITLVENCVAGINEKQVSELKKFWAENNVSFLSVRVPLSALPGDYNFVYGSNLRGIHGAGAARIALQKYGAVMGKDKFNGRSFGISTKDRELNTLPISNIDENIHEFLLFAEKHPELPFKVTRIGCGLAGLSDGEIAPLFAKYKLPSNLWFDTAWFPWLGNDLKYWGTF